MKIIPFLLLSIILAASSAAAQTYEELRGSVRAVKDTARQTEGLSAQQTQVNNMWETGMLIDRYLLDSETPGSAVIPLLAADLNEDPSRIYYALQFARTYPSAPPALDLHWGFYQYLLAVNDPRERDALAQRAFEEKWNWDKLRAEVQTANFDNKAFVFTETPGETGIYRVMPAKRGPHQGHLVLDLGFGVYYRLPEEKELKAHETVRALCETPDRCVFTPLQNAEKDLFTYRAEVIRVMDGDTFEAEADLGFGMTTRQTFRLWGLDAPEINTKAGRKAKQALEELIADKHIILRSMKMDKYGRYLADIFAGEKEKTIYVNQALIDQGLAKKIDRSMR